ncbi:MAG: ADP-ribosylglycohydrolase family protein [Acholeplasmataceae bacterium]|nr:ADP-ribosylglycohydrolase family protein [Acholeplasmataceae bacterium]
MIGAILGDIIGSRYEFDRIKTKDFTLLTKENNFITDDTIMTIAIGKAILEAKTDFDLLSIKAKESMLKLGNQFPSGYGYMFKDWLKSEDPQPYNSYGNGSAMRVSPCGMAYDNIDDVIKCAHAVTKVTHNHPEGMKAAEATAVATFMAKKKMSKYDIRIAMSKYYNMFTNLDEIRPRYHFTEEAKYTVPQAIICFLESTDFEDAIRNAVSLGGDADTLGAIAGGIAGAYYGVPKDLYIVVDSYVYQDTLVEIMHRFDKKYITKKYNSAVKEIPVIFKWK